MYQGSKLKTSSGHLATNWKRKFLQLVAKRPEDFLIARSKFLVASLYNINDTAYGMACSIRFDFLKISRTEDSINLEGK